MHCMKCGAQTSGEQVFCDHCLSTMDQYPVKPDIHIHLPKRARTPDSGKKPAKKKRTLTPEEQIAALQLRVRRLRLATAVLIFLVSVVTCFLMLSLYQQYQDAPIPGRNYTIDVTMD